MLIFVELVCDVDEFFGDIDVKLVGVVRIYVGF